MTEPQTSITNLLQALQIAAASDTIDDACAIIQNAVGVEDTAIRALCFSDIRRSPGPGKGWRSLSPNDRHDRLVTYIKLALDYAPKPDVAVKLTIPGFEPYHTGGGCMALAKRLPDGSQWLVSSEDGTEIPCVGDEIGVGHYGEDGEIHFEKTYVWDQFKPSEFLAMVEARTPSDQQSTPRLR